jgi:hypothetical protein
MTDKTPPKRERPPIRTSETKTYKPLKNHTYVQPFEGTMEESKAALKTAYEENYSNTQPTWRINAQQAPFLGMLKNLYEVRGIQPVKLTPEVLEEVIERLWTGETLSGICMDDHIPAYKNLCKFMELHPDVEAMIEKAKMRGTHALVDAMVDIANGGPLSTGDKIRDAELVKLVKWILGKRNSYYTDNVKITHETEQHVFVLPQNILPGEYTDKDKDEDSE